TLQQNRKYSNKDDLISLLHEYKDAENEITDTEILALTLNILLAATEPITLCIKNEIQIN
ncbi:TPA: hypothetical protein ACOGB1_002767, partial [Staphylococcus aureus]|nr:hypothetical protein [Staphylococcus aureus]MCE3392601.1 hypothetical protein [Staphylococcus aureus]